MNYDDINEYVEQRPWVVILVAFVVISLCLVVLFMNYENKVNVDSKTYLPVALKQSPTTKRMLETHKKSQVQPSLVNPFLKALTLVQCGVGTQKFVPLCARCNHPLHALGGNHQHLLECPICKQQTKVPCKNNNNAMNIAHGHNNPTINNKGTATNGYVCPVCQRNGTPNWTAKGVPTCPYCQNTMVLQRGGIQ